MLLLINVSSFAGSSDNVFDITNQYRTLYRLFNRALSPEVSEKLKYLLKYTSEMKIDLLTIEAVVGSGIYTEDEVMGILSHTDPQMTSNELIKLRKDVKKFSEDALNKVNKIVNSEEYLAAWLTYRAANNVQTVGSIISINSQTRLINIIDRKIEHTKGMEEQLEGFERGYLPNSDSSVESNDDETKIEGITSNK